MIHTRKSETIPSLACFAPKTISEYSFNLRERDMKLTCQWGLTNDFAAID